MPRLMRRVAHSRRAVTCRGIPARFVDSVVPCCTESKRLHSRLRQKGWQPSTRKQTENRPIGAKSAAFVASSSSSLSPSSSPSLFAVEACAAAPKNSIARLQGCVWCGSGRRQLYPCKRWRLVAMEIKFCRFFPRSPQFLHHAPSKFPTHELSIICHRRRDEVTKSPALCVFSSFFLLFFLSPTSSYLSRPDWPFCFVFVIIAPSVKLRD